MALLDKMLHMGEGRQLKKLKVVADQVNLIEPDFEAMSDDELRGQTELFRTRFADGWKGRGHELHAWRLSTVPEGLSTASQSRGVPFALELEEVPAAELSAQGF